MKYIELYWNGYRFTSDGEVFNLNGTPKKWISNGKGYPITGFVIDVVNKTKAIHRIVAELWYGPCPTGYEVDHLDDNRSNFKPDNLAYKTKYENNTKSYKTGNRNIVGDRNANSKFSSEEIEKVCIMIRDGATNREIKDVLDNRISSTTTYYIRSGKQLAHISTNIFTKE